MSEYEKQFSTTSVNTGGREGTSYIEGGSFEVDILPPGSKRDGANPEELFALGYSACFHGSLKEAKEKKNINNEAIVNITVSMAKNPETDDMKLQAEIKVGIEDMGHNQAQELADKAHELCPYSRAIKNGHIDVTVDAVPYEEIIK